MFVFLWPSFFSGCAKIHELCPTGAWIPSVVDGVAVEGQLQRRPRSPPAATSALSTHSDAASTAPSALRSPPAATSALSTPSDAASAAPSAPRSLPAATSALSTLSDAASAAPPRCQSGCALGVSRFSMDDVFFRPVLTRRVFFFFQVRPWC